MLRAMTKNVTFALAGRAHRLGDWLAQAAPSAHLDQRHLDEGSQEQAYWHLGYRAALIDALELITAEAGDTPDIASRCRADDRDG
jgi:hypothetical protein